MKNEESNMDGMKETAAYLQRQLRAGQSYQNRLEATLDVKVAQLEKAIVKLHGSEFGVDLASGESETVEFTPDPELESDLEGIDL